MKYITSFDNHNESWRQAKAYLKIPNLIIDLALSKILNYIPKLNLIYDSMAAKIDTGTSGNSGIGTELSSFKEIKLEDIKDEKVKRSLKLSGLFKDWHIYKLDRVSHDGRTPIYISKDVLNQGDKIHGERLRDVSYTRYDNKADGYNDEKGNWITEFYVVAAKHSNEHETMKKERDGRYANKKYKEFKEKVNKAIKYNSFMGRTSVADFTPLFHTLIKNNYVDLVKKCLDSVSNPKVKRNMIVDKYNKEGDLSIWNSSVSFNYSAVELANTIWNSPGSIGEKSRYEVKDILQKALYELWLQKNNNK
jgi:hypothetical protein